MTKKLFRAMCVFLAVCLVMALLPQVALAAGDYHGKTVVLYTGNLRGNVGMLPLIASARADFEARGAEVILVDTGNFLQGTRYTSFNSGSTMITLMLAAGYDMVALGTYDFAFGTGTIGAARMAEVHGDVIDFGPLGELLEANPALRALSANISGANAFFHSFAANKAFTTDGGVEMGFFALTDTATPDFILEPHLAGLRFEDPAGAAAAQVAALAGADIIIGLSNAPAGQVPGAIMIHTAPVAVPGPPAVGAVVINNATGEYERRGIDLSAFTADAGLEAVVGDFKAEVAAAFPMVARSTVTLEGSVSATRGGETSLGNLWADALRWFAVSGEINAFFGEDDIASGNDRIQVSADYVVALWNAGNLRDFLHPGDVIMQDLRRVLPFPNTVAVVYLTGAELLEQLEASAQGLPFSPQTYTLAASFMHVSGIEYTIDLSRPFNPGVPYRDRIWYTAASVERVTITSVNGAPFNESAIYAVITSNANFNGMDISYVLAARESDTQNRSTITTARVTDHAVMGFIASLPGATIGAEQAALQGRITVTGAPQRLPAIRLAVGEYLDGSAPFVGDDGQIMVPMRAVAEALDATVAWVRQTQTAYITTAQGQTLSVNTRQHPMVRGRTFVTVDFISESLGVTAVVSNGVIYFYAQ
ncbi:MAG: 5'-nucleotidase C-terminal domain-containing protein [Defluviitaleaceae bacterium]|nr:5'-nucleotidase C-terminal domain-containing protein [Defluviitaleaceae bacterium]MCL2240825.1 5'-nucleotidase C-terminal domain-containing protein [Defluviitaleaceae bacterium]